MDIQIAIANDGHPQTLLSSLGIAYLCNLLGPLRLLALRCACGGSLGLTRTLQRSATSPRLEPSFAGPELWWSVTSLFWNPDVLCPYSVHVWLPWKWNPGLGDPCWGCILSEFPAGTSASLAFLAFSQQHHYNSFSHSGHSECRPSLPAPQDSPNIHYSWAGVPPHWAGVTRPS